MCARVLGPADRFHTEHANSRGTRTTRKRFRTVSGRDRRCPLAHGKHQIVNHSLTARWAARNGSGQWLDSRKFLSGQMASPALRWPVRSVARRPASAIKGCSDHQLHRMRRSPCRLLQQGPFSAFGWMCRSRLHSPSSRIQATAIHRRPPSLSWPTMASRPRLPGAYSLCLSVCVPLCVSLSLSLSFSLFHSLPPSLIPFLSLSLPLTRCECVVIAVGESKNNPAEWRGSAAGHIDG